MKKLNLLLSTIAVSLVAVGLTACGSTEPAVTEQTRGDAPKVSDPFDNYPGAEVKKAPAKAVSMPTGLVLQDIEEGFGLSPSPQREVYVHYTGYLANGAKFDSSLDRGMPFVFKIGSGKVIPGFEQGLMTMKVGGTRRITVPPKLAYGAAGKTGKVPPNETLTYEVKLLCSDR